MRKKLLTEVILPVYVMQNCVLICISSPQGKNNFYSKLFFQTHPETGEDLFNKFAFEAVCSRCKATRHPERCRHEMWKYPPWLDVAKMNIVSIVLSEDVGTFQREQQGLITEDSSNSFVSQKMVDILLGRPGYEWKNNPNGYPAFVLITADVNQGGHCDSAWTAGVRIAGQDVVSCLILFFFVYYCYCCCFGFFSIV